MIAIRRRTYVFVIEISRPVIPFCTAHVSCLAKSTRGAQRDYRTGNFNNENERVASDRGQWVLDFPAGVSAIMVSLHTYAHAW